MKIGSANFDFPFFQILTNVTCLVCLMNTNIWLINVTAMLTAPTPKVHTTVDARKAIEEAVKSARVS